MYKDKDKQREADRERQRRYRRDANLRRDKQGVTKGVTKQGSTEGVTITKADSHVDVSTISAVETLHKALEFIKPKPAKGIKTFADLPPHVQQTIDRISVDEAERKRRTAIAINYQASLSRHRLYGLSLGV